MRAFGGVFALNPFSCPDKIYISSYPQDMRCGIESLAHKVALSFGRDAYDGSLFGFVSSDAKKMKLIRYEKGCWCMYYLKLEDRVIRWPSSFESYLVQVNERELLRLLKGGSVFIQKMGVPPAKRYIL